ncbi:MAG: response regulator transcription factor [Chloroflexota bacterium]|nr:response regulator transcription factor [Chloroflexota bacterium]
MKRILLIEDDVSLNRLTALQLRHEGYEVITAFGGHEGLNMALEQSPDLVILDVMMPVMTGWEVCRHLRSVSDVPVIMLTARGTQEDVIQGLELGADDYIRKPFDRRELLLRVQALLRRSPEERRQRAVLYDDGTLSIDEKHRVVTRAGKPVHLAPTEFRLLTSLVRRADQVVPHVELLTDVWGPEYAEDTAILPVYIRYVRKKIEDEPERPRYIVTEWGIGYRFISRDD